MHFFILKVDFRFPPPVYQDPRLLNFKEISDPLYYPPSISYLRVALLTLTVRLYFSSFENLVCMYGLKIRKENGFPACLVEFFLVTRIFANKHFFLRGPM